MSQPPQPPNQPPPGSPQGGFGAPQDPSFGYPQQPPGTPAPGQPGYGYPQAPGQPPHTPPGPYTPPPPPGVPPIGAGGYGYPGQPGPSPYNAPTVGMPGQQPQYGVYPPQQPYPQGNAPQGDNQKSKRRMAVIIGAVVAVAVIAAAGVFFATQDDGGDTEAKGGDKNGTQGPTNKDGFKKKPAPKVINSKLLNTIPMPKVTEQVTVEGMWATDKVFAKTEVYKISGYPLDGGNAQWEIPLDGAMCWASPHVTDEGLTAVLFEDHKPKGKSDYATCSEVGLVDLDNGKLLWQKHTEQTGDPIRFDEVTIGGGTVAAGGTSGGAAWSVKTGKELWKPKLGEDCSDDGYAGGEKLVAVRRCGEYDDPTMQVQTLNPNTGAPMSSYTVPKGIDYVHVASTDPLVIGFDAGDKTGSGLSDFFVIDDSTKTGKLRSKIATMNGKYTARCAPHTTNVESCRQVAISKEADALFMGTEERSSSNSGTENEIVAFSMKTGKAIGKADGVEGAPIVPLHLDEDGYIIAYQDSSYDRGGAVWRIDPTSYEKVQLMQNPTASAQLEGKFGPDYQWMRWANNHLYMGDVYATKPYSSYDKDDPLAMIFGTG